MIARLLRLLRRDAFIRERAGIMLLNPTWCEQRLYNALCRALPGHDIRMQHVVGAAIIDIAILDCRLAVEVDGAHHLRPAQRKRDATRTRRLRWRRWRVIRASNHDVRHNLPAVLDTIRRACWQ